MAESFKNKIIFDLVDNPDLSEAFLLKNPGDKCELEIELILDEKSKDRIVGTVKSITVPDYTAQTPVTDDNGDAVEDESGSPKMKKTKSPKTVVSSPTAPIMIVLGGDS